MQNITLRFPSSILFGQDVLAGLGQTVKGFGNRVLLISEGALHDGDHIGRTAEILRRSGLEVIVYDELNPGTPSSRVDEIASLARAGRAQVIVGLGGMRVLSIARCVSNLSENTIKLADLFGGRHPKQPFPYVEVPSSFRNHLMMREEAIMKDTPTGRIKVVRLAPGTVRAVIADTSFSQTLSSKYALAAILDTLLAAVEGFFSTNGSMYSDTLLGRAMNELHGAAMTGIRAPTDPRFRVRAAEAGMLVAMALAVTGQGMGGALAYGINSRFSLPKSWVSAILLPHVIDILVNRDMERAARVAAAMGEPVGRIIAAEDAPRASRAIRKLVSQLDLPPRLRDLDVTLDELGRCAEEVADLPMLANVPGGASLAELQQLVSAAY